MTPTCRACGSVLAAGRARRSCAPARRQRAYRARSAPPLPAPRLTTEPSAHAAGRQLQALDECSGCGERLTERRCPDCNLSAHRLGAGGVCGCGEIFTVEELQAGAG